MIGTLDTTRRGQTVLLGRAGPGYRYVISFVFHESQEMVNRDEIGYNAQQLDILT